jgi:hypothetical protein
MNVGVPTVLVILALIFAVLAAIQPQPFLPRVHPGWLAMAFYFASFLVR